VTYLNYQDKYLPLELYAATVVDVCIARGVNINKLLRGTGVFKADIIKGEHASPSQILRLFSNAQALTPGYDCAFQIGRRLAANQQNTVMQALHYSRSFEESLRLVTLFENICSPFIAATFIKQNGSGYWLLKQKLGLGKLEQFVMEIFCTALVSLSQHVLGHRIKFHFGFQWQKPKQIQEYEENLGYRTYFEQPANVIAVQWSSLAKSYIIRNDLLKRHAIHKANELVMCKLSLLEHVRYLIAGSPIAPLPQIAEQLKTSPATLKRKLKEHGSSFKQLHDEVRKHQAIHCLILQGLNNEQSALLMDISDATNFRRSIKRWTGYTPSELKKTCDFLPLIVLPS
jgi:AraC-like DNA-binding protein